MDIRHQRKMVINNIYCTIISKIRKVFIQRLFLMKQILFWLQFLKRRTKFLAARKK